MILFPCVSPRKWLPLFVRNALTMVLHRHRLSSRRSSSSCSSNGVAVLLQYRLAKSPLLSQILCLYSCHSDHKDSFSAVLFYFAFYFRLSEAKFPLTQKARENRNLLALQHLLQYFLMQNTEKAGHSRTDYSSRPSPPFAHRTA